MTTPPTYVPGWRKSKAAMVIAGLALFIIGISQLSSPLLLLCRGHVASAEAVRVVKTKKGLQPVILSSDLEIDQQREPHDPSYIFWNDFAFTAADGRPIQVRCPVGSKGGPLYPLTGNDGLPTTALIYYNPSHPETVVFPLLFSTWLVPAIFLLTGLLGSVIGGILFHWADKPIEMPHIPD